MALLILVLLFQLEERRTMTQYSTSGRCVCLCMCALTDPQSTAGTATHSTSLLKKRTSIKWRQPSSSASERHHNENANMVLESQKDSWHSWDCVILCCFFLRHVIISKRFRTTSPLPTPAHGKNDILFWENALAGCVQICNDGLGYYSCSVFSQDWLNLRSKLFSEARLV